MKKALTTLTLLLLVVGLFAHGPSPPNKGLENQREQALQSPISVSTMYIDKYFILGQLPDYKDKWETVMARQAVPDIMKSIFESHKKFGRYYDKIGIYFAGSSLSETCENLYSFCKSNIRYREEDENWQSTALPTGILVRGYGDCKHYASFIAGCLAAIERAEGVTIDWCYCFASYKWSQQTPYHVFVIVTDEEGNQIWVDPTPGAENKEPVWVLTKKP